MNQINPNATGKVPAGDACCKASSGLAGGMEKPEDAAKSLAEIVKIYREGKTTTQALPCEHF